MTKDKMTFTGATLSGWGLNPGPAFKIILARFDEWTKTNDEATLRAWLLDAQNDPSLFLDHEVIGEVATIWKDEIERQLTPKPIPLRAQPMPFESYGAKGIEAGAMDQMKTAMRLPIATAGAVMPDAHHGYGLPIGGVLAVNNAVIPYGVGVDIGCRMCLSVFPEPIGVLASAKTQLVKLLQRNAYFGRATNNRYAEHAITDDPRFQSTDLVRNLRERAQRQLGSSGGGNHFVEWGIVEIMESDEQVGLAPGEYLGLLSHSGSRGMGAAIADYYTKRAMEVTKLPEEARHLAWLGLDTELGLEYWEAMNLAGDYASACHHVIHDRMSIGLRSNALVRIENHHNFAWKELDSDGVERIVHRKGATPAGKGVLGIIPGSMTAPGFIVRGRGTTMSLNSAAHGAGRQMSRTVAKKTIEKSDWDAELTSAGVTLIGAGLDEAPQAYKDIHEVMAAQVDLVDVLGTFQPKIVRMCGEKSFRERD
ncbi:MAG: RtcB family protein [Saprospiraceae bacterium]